MVRNEVAGSSMGQQNWTCGELSAFPMCFLILSRPASPQECAGERAPTLTGFLGFASFSTPISKGIGAGFLSTRTPSPNAIPPGWERSQ